MLSMAEVYRLPLDEAARSSGRFTTHSSGFS
jgi:hypothetical protein